MPAMMSWDDDALNILWSRRDYPPRIGIATGLGSPSGTKEEIPGFTLPTTATCHDCVVRAAVMGYPGLSTSRTPRTREPSILWESVVDYTSASARIYSNS